MHEILHGGNVLPRSGPGTYTLPATYEAVSGETIEAQQHNDPLEDLESDANTARPIVAGGTGETTAIGAADALSTKGSNIASGTTTDIGAATGRFVHITGTTTITAFGTKTAGVVRFITFDGILTLTHNATSLILPGAADITTAANDSCVAVSEGSGNWRVLTYQRAAGLPITASSTDTLTNKTLTAPTVNNPVLTLAQGATATPTAEGRVEWDTDDNVLAVGDGAATQLFVPIPASTAAGDLEYYTGAKVKARLAKGTASQILTMNSGATAPEWATPASGLTSGTAISLSSGTTSDFTSIPSGVKLIHIGFHGISFNTVGIALAIQIGDSGGVETTGYKTTADGAAVLTSTSDIRLSGSLSNSSDALYGQCTLMLIDSATNTWAYSYASSRNGSTVYIGGGTKALSAELDRVRLLCVDLGSGSFPFDAGLWNILYE